MAINLGSMRQAMLPGLEKMVVGRTTYQKGKDLRMLGMVMNCRVLEVVGRQMMDANKLSNKPLTIKWPEGPDAAIWSGYSDVSPLLK